MEISATLPKIRPNVTKTDDVNIRVRELFERPAAFHPIGLGIGSLIGNLLQGQRNWNVLSTEALMEGLMSTEPSGAHALQDFLRWKSWVVSYVRLKPISLADIQTYFLKGCVFLLDLCKIFYKRSWSRKLLTIL